MMDLEEITKRVYDWRIHVSTPAERDVEFQLDEEDDDEIALEIDEFLLENFDEYNPYEDEDGMDYDDPDFPEEDDDYFYRDDDDEDEDDDEEDEDRPNPWKMKMKEDQEKIKETAPDTIIQYKEDPLRQLGFHVYQGDLYFLYEVYDAIPVDELPDKLIDKICAAIEKKLAQS